MKRTISALNKAIAAQEKALEILKAELQKLEADTGAVGTAPVASKKPRQEKPAQAEGRQPRKSRAERAAEKEAAATQDKADKRPQKQTGDDVKPFKKKKA